VNGPSYGKGVSAEEFRYACNPPAGSTPRRKFLLRPAPTNDDAYVAAASWASHMSAERSCTGNSIQNGRMLSAWEINTVATNASAKI
jgi:hypothetical protein